MKTEATTRRDWSIVALTLAAVAVWWAPVDWLIGRF